jgi:hypothetical protein
VGRTELGQVVNIQALDASSGARGLFRVRVPASWAAAGSQIALTVPTRVECARCSGGGCDGCGKSGALKAPRDPSARALRLEIPKGSTEGVALRLAHPFGEGAEIEQLIIEVRCGDAPSEGVSRIAAPHPRPRRGRRVPRDITTTQPARAVGTQSILVPLVVAIAAFVVALFAR